MALTLGAVASQTQFYIDFLHQYGALSRRALARIHVYGFLRVAEAIANTLLVGRKMRFSGHEFSVADCRSLSGGSVGAVLIVDRRITPQKGLKAFVGHRFTDRVTRNLRHNLQLTMRPYGISLWYADNDMPNEPVFETILRRIRASHFCIFDDRETEVRPNVFIELGAAIALQRPYFYLNYQNKHTVQLGRRSEAIQTPSDLAGMLYLPYAAYEDLFRQFAARLPGFLLDRGLARK